MRLVTAELDDPLEIADRNHLFHPFSDYSAFNACSPFVPNRWPCADISPFISLSLHTNLLFTGIILLTVNQNSPQPLASGNLVEDHGNYRLGSKL